MLFTVSCAVTVAGTRAYLDLANYPQIGGGVYHIAHALWGGLALTIASLLVLMLTNRWILPTVAVMGGVGAGLFIDEVGKFITRDNDYFFPLAAPIVYVFLVGLIVLVILLRRSRHQSARAYLHGAFEIAARSADTPLTSTDVRQLNDQLQQARAAQPNKTERQTIAALERLTESLGAHAIPEADRPFLQRVALRIGERRLRRIVRLLLTIQALIGLSIVAITLFMATAGLEAYSLYDVKATLANQDIEIVDVISMITWIVSAVLAAIAVWSLRPRHVQEQRATRYTIISMLLLLTIANLLGSYSSQFSIFIDASVQGLTILALVLWRLARTHATQIENHD